MSRVLVSSLVAALVVASTALSSAQAGSSRYSSGARISDDRVYVPSRRSGPQVRGFSRSVGGYSYTYEDGIAANEENTLYQDPSLNQQSGPFDSGFFFDSNATAPNRSQSPYP